MLNPNSTELNWYELNWREFNWHGVEFTELSCWSWIDVDWAQRTTDKLNENENQSFILHTLYNIGVYLKFNIS